MNVVLQRWILLPCFALLFSIPGSSLPFSDFGNAEFSDLRSLIDRSQSDLRMAAGLNHGNKQTSRYQKAQDYLSKFDKSLSHGKFNKSALNDSIDELKSVLDHNTIQASARDALMRDFSDLKVARARR